MSVIVNASFPKVIVGADFPTVDVETDFQKIDINIESVEVALNTDFPKVDIISVFPKVDVKTDFPKVSVNVETPKVEVVSPSVVNNFLYGRANLYIQSSPMAEWVVNHNLGYYPVVDVYTSGMVSMDGEVIHLSVNQFLVRFVEPVSGVVIYG